MNNNYLDASVHDLKNYIYHGILMDLHDRYKKDESQQDFVKDIEKVYAKTLLNELRPSEEATQFSKSVGISFERFPWILILPEHTEINSMYIRIAKDVCEKLHIPLLINPNSNVENLSESYVILTDTFDAPDLPLLEKSLTVTITQHNKKISSQKFVVDSKLEIISDVLNHAKGGMFLAGNMNKKSEKEFLTLSNHMAPNPLDSSYTRARNSMIVMSIEENTKFVDIIPLIYKHSATVWNFSKAPSIDKANVIDNIKNMKERMSNSQSSLTLK